VAYAYIAPITDMRFVIEQVLEAPRSWSACGGFAELDMDTAGAVLDEAALRQRSPAAHQRGRRSRRMQAR
jgi:hypothetical protein